MRHSEQIRLLRCVRFDDAEWQAIGLRAEALGVSRSFLIRSCVMAYIHKTNGSLNLPQERTGAHAGQRND